MKATRISPKRIRQKLQPPLTVKWLVLYAFLFVNLILMLGMKTLSPDLAPFQEGKLKVTRWLPGQGKQSFNIGPSTSRFTKLEDISHHLTNAVIASEDGRFYDHAGVDLIEIYKSLITNMEAGRVVRGGSTITQQVIKLAFFHGQKRTIFSKISEAIGAFRLELLLEKDEILAWYLNLANFGLGEVGIQNATRTHFNTDPLFLTVSQSIILAMILPSPNIRGNILNEHSMTEKDRKRFEIILNRLYQTGKITNIQRKIAMRIGNFGSPIDRLDENAKKTL